MSRSPHIPETQSGDIIRVAVGFSLVLSTLALLIAIASSPLVEWF